MSEDLDRELERLAGVANCSKSDVMRRGFALMKVAVDAKSLGCRLAVVDSERALVSEIIGI
jgi:hypothetical protein